MPLQYGDAFLLVIRQADLEHPGECFDHGGTGKATTLPHKDKGTTVCEARRICSIVLLLLVQSIRWSIHWKCLGGA